MKTMKRNPNTPIYGIDVGAGSVRLVDLHEGILFDEPCVVALDKYGNAVAVGLEALDMKESADGELRVVHPFAGKHVDYDALDAMLEEICFEHHVFRLFQKPILLVSYPTSLSQEAFETFEDHLHSFGALQVLFEEEVWISAVGARLNINHPVGSCVLNIGHSNCDIALFSNGRLFAKQSGTLSGKSLSDLIIWWMRSSYGLEISRHQADQIKEQIGSAVVTPRPLALEVTGIDVHNRSIRSVIIDENQTASLIAPLVHEWAGWIRSFLEKLPENFQRDLSYRGIVCCGGTMQLKGLAASLKSLVGCPFFVTDEPADTVANGLKILMMRMQSS